MSDLVGNPKDRFSLVTAHIYTDFPLQGVQLRMALVFNLLNFLNYFFALMLLYMN